MGSCKGREEKKNLSRSPAYACSCHGGALDSPECKNIDYILYTTGDTTLLRTFICSSELSVYSRILTLLYIYSTLLVGPLSEPGLIVGSVTPLSFLGLCKNFYCPIKRSLFYGLIPSATYNRTINFSPFGDPCSEPSTMQGVSRREPPKIPPCLWSPPLRSKP